MAEALQTAEGRLDSWKEIAVYLGRTVRTVHRWEQTAGLPVYRCAGARSSVYAYRSEIDGWLKGGPAGRDIAAELARRWSRAIRLCALLVLIPLGIWQALTLGRKPPALRVVPLTTYPGAEVYPALSRDGKQVAFSWNGPNGENSDIYTRLIDGGLPVRLTSDPAVDSFPAFSPDGHRIAFRRGLDVYVIPAIGGAERKLASCVRFLPPLAFGKLSWSADGKWIAFADRDRVDEPSSIFSVSADTGERRRLTTAPRGLSVRWGDVQPAYSFDGKKLAFVRGGGQSNAAIFVLSLSSDATPAGEPTRVTPYGSSPRGLDWSPDNRSIIYSSPDGSMRVLAKGGQRPELIIREVRSLGMSVAPLTGRAAYHKALTDSNIWRTSPAQHLAPTRLIASTLADFAPEYSPDGSRIVFASDRSGSHELWICDSDGGNPVRLTFFDGPVVGMARWSPDGRRIAFVSQASGHVGVYVMPASGGTPVRLTDGRSNDSSPAWSRDGRRIYFASDRSGQYQIWKMPAAGEEAAQITRKGGMFLNTSYDGKSIYYVKLEEEGIWRVPCEGGEEIRVLEHGVFQDWELSRTGIYLLRRELNRLELYPFGARVPSSTPEFPASTRFAMMRSRQIAISPDERWILYSQVDREDADLMLVENVR